jgi:ribokinase
VYFNGGDHAALAATRQAGVVVATPRAGEQVLRSGPPLDALVYSDEDDGEREVAALLAGTARYEVRTMGARGGAWSAAGGRHGTWAATALHGTPADSAGCGDSFAGGLTAALGAGWALEDAIALGARCGAACLTGFGPYAAQLVEDVAGQPGGD